MFNKLLTKTLKLMGYVLETREEALEFAKRAKYSDTLYQGALSGGRTPLSIRKDPSIIFNYVGEHTSSPQEIYITVSHYHALLQSYAASDKREISIKPTQFGDNIGLINCLAKKSTKKAKTLWIDAEEYELADKQLELAKYLSGCHYSVGLTIQLRSDRYLTDAKECFSKGIKVRLCKGAYPQPQLRKKHLLDRAKLVIHFHELYRGPSLRLLEIATIRDMDLAMLTVKNELPLQALYGWHKRFLDYPYGLTIYIPFGTCWWPYIKRRIKEKISRGG